MIISLKIEADGGAADHRAEPDSTSGCRPDWGSRRDDQQSRSCKSHPGFSRAGHSRHNRTRQLAQPAEPESARPDVMAVLHAHTLELVAFTESSVALRPVVNGGVFIGDGLPMHDIRKFDPRENIIRTSELGQTVATVLGKKPAVLLKGHGIALTGSSLQHRHQPPPVDITVHGSTGSRSFRLTSK